jgi:hypothetical protein
MSTSSCLSSPLTDDEKSGMRASREDQLRETFREAIVRDLLTIYTSTGATENPVDELLASMDVAIGVDRRKIFLEVLKEAALTIEEACSGGGTQDPV